MIKATGGIDSAKLTIVNIMYQNLLIEPNSKSSKVWRNFKEWMPSLKRSVRELKDTLVRLSLDRSKSELLTMKFNVPHHLCNGLKKFWSMHFLYAIP